jgi:hypothetical protein
MAAVRELVAWKPQIDSGVGNLRTEVSHLANKVEELVLFRDNLQPAL